MVAGTGGRIRPEVVDDDDEAGAVISGLKEQTYRRGGCRSRRNMFQLAGADGAMTPELVVVARKRAPCRWQRFEAAGPSARRSR